MVSSSSKSLRACVNVPVGRSVSRLVSFVCLSAIPPPKSQTHTHTLKGHLAASGVVDSVPLATDDQVWETKSTNTLINNPSLTGMSRLT